MNRFQVTNFGGNLPASLRVGDIMPNMDSAYLASKKIEEMV